MRTNLGSFDASPAAHTNGASAAAPHPVPPAGRTATSGWRDPRLWIGIALVAASVLIGANLLADEDERVAAWVAARDLAPGESVATTDLEVVKVDLAETGVAYLLAGDELPSEAVLRRPVAAGELVPTASLHAPAAAEVEVALWAPSVSVPDAVRAGSLVDVWVVPEDGEAGRTPALAGVRVVAAPRSDDGLGPSGDRQVVVAVPDDLAASIGMLLSAAHDVRLVVTKRG